MSQYDQPQIDLGKFRPIIIGAIAFLVLVIFVSKSFIILEPTERGVVFYKYGSGLAVDDVKTEGFNFMMPWNTMYRFDISEQKLDETMDVLSSNGLQIKVDVSVLFRPNPDKVGYLYQKFRLDYADKLVKTNLRAAVREVIGRYTPEELYSTKREEIRFSITEATEKALSENHAELTTLVIRSVQLPPAILNAIEKKLKEEQEQLAYKYRLIKEESEAERKRIAAEGEAKANSIINSSLTPSLLKMRGIEATKDMAQSDNAKVIVIGGGKDGLPLILNGN